MMRAFHRRIFAPWRVACLSVLLLSASCRKETGFDTPKPVPDGGGSISFTETLPEGWNEVTRSGNSGSYAISDDLEVGSTPDGLKLLMHVEMKDRLPSDALVYDDEENPETKADDEAPDYDDFGLYSYLMRGESKPSAFEYSEATEFMINNFVDVSAGYKYNPVKYWPGSGYWLKFFAYRPFHENLVFEGVPYLSVDDEGKIPELTYTVPEDVEKQKDLQGAVTEMYEGTKKLNDTPVEKVTLNFRHLLSEVNFKVGTMDGATISKFGLTGIKNTGKYGDWSSAGFTASGSGTGDFTQDLTVGGTLTGFDAGAKPGSIFGKPFYMIPQLFADDGAKLWIDIKFRKEISAGVFSEGDTYHLDVPLNKFTLNQWNANKKYTYSLTTPEEINIDIDDELVDNKRKKQNLEITNTGLATVYIRAVAVGYWTIINPDVEYAGGHTIIANWDSRDTSEGGDGTFTWPAGNSTVRYPDPITDDCNWYKAEDGFYYYMKPLHRGETAEPLFESYEVTSGAPVLGAKLELTIAGQAILASDIGKMEGKWDEIAIKKLIAKSL